MSTWYAVHTHPQAEGRAAFHLTRQGYGVYLPRYLKRRSHARKVDHVPAPLFPRYLFVNIDESAGRWRSINSTVGVSHLVCQGTRPMEVPGEIIASIREQENETGIVSLNPTKALRPGDKVLVNAGPFDQRVGLFEELSDNQRVTLLLGLMGQQVRVQLNAELVEKVG